MSQTTCVSCGDKLSPYRFRPEDNHSVRSQLEERCRACLFGIENTEVTNDEPKE